MEEVFDLVNDKNEVIGKVKRSIAHSFGFLHRSTTVVIFNSKGEIFLQKRSPGKKICPNTWDIGASEHLKAGESYEEATIRGLEEELGIAVDSLEFIEDYSQDFSYYDGKVKDNEKDKIFKIIYDGKITIDKVEVCEGKFFKINEVKKMIKKEKFAPWAIIVWDALLNKNLI